MTPDRIVGVDFSGARDARDNVWLAACRVGDGDPPLRCERCAPAAEALAPLDGSDPTATIDALRTFVREQSPTTAVAVDAPFGLPAAVARGLGAPTWRETLAAVAECGDPDAFASACVDAVDGTSERTYRRRETDRAVGSLSPYHFFVEQQTYHCLSGLLRPLVADDAVLVPPVDDVDRTWGEAAAADDASPDGDRPVLLETYPAATLDRLGGHREAYKTADETGRERRRVNLNALAGVVTAAEPVAERVVDDADGDGLDALAAAAGAYRWAVGAAPGPARDDDAAAVEGWIYA